MGRSAKPTELSGVVMLVLSSEWGMLRKPTVTQATKSYGRDKGFSEQDSAQHEPSDVTLACCACGPHWMPSVPHLL